MLHVWLIPVPTSVPVIIVSLYLLSTTSILLRTVQSSCSSIWRRSGRLHPSGITRPTSSSTNRSQRPLPLHFLPHPPLEHTLRLTLPQTVLPPPPSPPMRNNSQAPTITSKEDQPPTQHLPVFPTQDFPTTLTQTFALNRPAGQNGANSIHKKAHHPTDNPNTRACQNKSFCRVSFFSPVAAARRRLCRLWLAD